MYPMYPECVAFLRKTMRVKEIVILVHLSHSHGFAQKRNAFRIYGTVPLLFGVRHWSASAEQASWISPTQLGVIRVPPHVGTKRRTKNLKIFYYWLFDFCFAFWAPYGTAPNCAPWAQNAKQKTNSQLQNTFKKKEI